MSLQFFIDSANPDIIQEANNIFPIDGVTTNPSLVSKENKDYYSLIQDISSLIIGPISAEVIATDCESMIKEGEVLSQLASNVVVKLPCTEDGLRATKILSSKDIQVNVTLCFSLIQAIFAAKAGAAYISPFIGRIDDLGFSGLNLIEDIVNSFCNYGFETQVLAASVRSIDHVIELIKLEVDAITLPPKIFFNLFKNPLTDIGLQKFLKDWEKSKK